jgi:hypothetical protein
VETLETLMDFGGNMHGFWRNINMDKDEIVPFCFHVVSTVFPQRLSK